LIVLIMISKNKVQKFGLLML